VGGTLAQLIRLQSAGLHLRQSITLETLAEQIQGETFEPIDPVTPLQHLPTLSLPADLAQRWCHGQKLPGALIPKKLSSLANVKQLDEPLDGTITRVHNLQGNFLGIGEWRRSEQGQLLAPKLVMS
jgi:tRNA pseudouridine55 synthase